MITPLSSATKAFIAQHLQDDVHGLALQSFPPGIDRQTVLQNITARQNLKNKVPLWAEHTELLFPPHLSLEQASSQATATYKADCILEHLKENTIEAKHLVDLTGGLGIDSYFIGQKFDHLTYIELQETLCTLAKHNFEALNLPQFTVIEGSSFQVVDQLPPVSAFFIDPARRDAAGNKTVSFQHCTPDISAAAPHLLTLAPYLFVKASPMMDITLACKELPNVKEVHIIALNNECKELFFVLERGYTQEPKLFPINLIQKRSTSNLEKMAPFTLNEEQNTPKTYAPEPLKYLYEPNASILKSGGFHHLAHETKTQLLSPNSHLYTSNTRHSNFPGRTFQIEHIIPYQKKALRTFFILKKRDKIVQANITTRNFPRSVAHLRQQLKLKDGGSLYIFASTNLEGQAILMLCHK